MTPREKLTIKLNHVILVQGFRNLTMAQLAKKAGVSRATMYLHFKNKDEIVEAVVSRHTDFISHNSIAEKPTINNLQKTLLNYSLIIGSTTELFLHELSKDYPQLYNNLSDQTQIYRQNMIQFLTNTSESKLLKTNVDPNYLVLQIELTIRGLLQQVQDQTISLQTGEKDLKLAFEFISTSYFGSLPKQTDVNDLSERVIAEYYDTYSLL